MKDITQDIDGHKEQPVESPGYAWLLATVLLITMIFLPILVA